MSASVTGRRYARRARVDRIVLAQPFSADAVFGSADEDAPAARRIGRPGRIVGADDLHAPQRHAHAVVGRVDVRRVRLDQRQPGGFVDGRRQIEEGHVQLPPARLHAQADVPRVVDVVPQLALLRRQCAARCPPASRSGAAVRPGPAPAPRAAGRRRAAVRRRLHWWPTRSLVVLGPGIVGVGAAGLGAAGSGLKPGTVNICRRSPSRLTSRCWSSARTPMFSRMSRASRTLITYSASMETRRESTRRRASRREVPRCARPAGDRRRGARTRRWGTAAACPPRGG